MHFSLLDISQTFSFFPRREMTCFAAVWTTWACDDECSILLTVVTSKSQQQVVTLRVCANHWTEVYGFIGSWRKKQTKLAGVLKIIIIFVISSLSVECRKDKVFCAICAKGLTASKSQRRAQLHAVSGNISDVVSCLGLPTDTSRIDGVLCNSSRTALLKYRKTGKNLFM